MSLIVPGQNPNCTKTCGFVDEIAFSHCLHSYFVWLMSNLPENIIINVQPIKEKNYLKKFKRHTRGQHLANLNGFSCFESRSKVKTIESIVYSYKTIKPIFRKQIFLWIIETNKTAYLSKLQQCNLCPSHHIKYCKEIDMWDK